MSAEIPVRTVPSPRARAAKGGNAPFLALLVLLTVVAAVVPVAGHSVTRAGIAVGVLALAVVQWVTDWRSTVAVLAGWLILLGLLRRLLTEVTGLTGADPLLLVAPAVLGLLFVTAVRAGALSRRSALTTAVLALSVLTMLEVANLSTAPLVAGVAALMFVLAPQLAFYLGRILPDGTLSAVLRVIAGLAVLVALYGLLQTFSGLPPWDHRWVAEAGYTALNVGGAIRPFGTSASAAEYTSLLAVGVICWVTQPVRPRWAAAVAVAVLATALVLASARGSVVLLVLALVFVAAARRSVAGGAAVLLAAAAVGLISVLASVLLPHAAGDSGTSALLQHQAGGLANPFDPSHSTLGLHWLMMMDGLTSVTDHPFGLGLGVMSIAGAKFGGEHVATEVDVSNIAVAFGPIGLVVFLAVSVLGLVRAYRVAARTHAPLALAALGIVIVTGNNWLNGGMYAVAWLPWLALGWLDRPTSDDGRGSRP